MGSKSQEILSLLSPSGPLAAKLDQFEERIQQKQMLQSILEAHEKGSLALLEAGTGVGKSLAYLIPALFAALEREEVSVISTHTITLQEQLMQKDLPFLLDSLNLDIPVALVKGMGNYLCLRKLYDLIDQASLFNLSEQEDLKYLEEWVQKTTEGSSSNLDKTPQNLTWDKVHCESSACSFVKCPHYKECFFFKARKKVKDAKLLIVNHNLLMVDMQAKEIEDKGAILPDYDHLVVDEAHTFEDIATSALAHSSSMQAITRKLNELISDRSSLGKIQRLKNKLFNVQDQLGSSLWNKLTVDLFSEKREVEISLGDAFYDLEDFFNTTNYNAQQNGLMSDRFELNEQMLQDPNWPSIQESFDQLVIKLSSLSTNLSILIQQIETSDKTIAKSVESLLVDIKALALFFEASSTHIKDFFASHPSPEKLYVIEKTQRKTYLNIQLSIIHLNIADILAESLFSPLISATLCSATLNYKGEFKFVKNQLGLRKPHFSNDRFIEQVLPSPFEYSKQVLLAACKDIPFPQTMQYLDVVCEQMMQALLASNGGAFILFTSFKMLNDCYERLLPFLVEKGLTPLKQGDENRSILLNTFKSNSKCVLFGTDTFWEGIDVPGFNLRLVILTKLPFPVPSEPLFKARCKRIEEAGGNPFMDYSIPKALIKFKQGFGRLIRTQNDFGCILCLDSRILTKRYGSIFIDSLPKCQVSFGNSEQVLKDVNRFYESKMKNNGA